MEKDWEDFWEQKWSKNQIKFHQKQINLHLQHHLNKLVTSPAENTIFVPLCGKSKDLLWLASQGLHVIGVELVEKAVLEFFTENQLQYATTRISSSLTSYSNPQYTIFCGDFFQISRSILPTIHSVFDRAALIALPPEIRIQYVEHMQTLISTGVKTLLITLEYPQQEMSGPPFSVPDTEIDHYFSPFATIDQLESIHVLEHRLQFRDQLSELTENVYLLEQKN